MRRITWALIAAGLTARAGFGIEGFDWDEMMIFAMGFAGVAYVIADVKRERKLDSLAIDFANKIGHLEAAAKAQLDRVEKLENVVADIDTEPPRSAGAFSEEQIAQLAAVVHAARAKGKR